MDKTQPESCLLLLDIGANDVETTTRMRRVATGLLCGRCVRMNASSDLYGSDTTYNPLHEKLDGYKSICLEVPMKKADEALLTELQKSPVGAGQRDYLDALVVAADYLISLESAKKNQKRIILITDGRANITGEEHMGAVVQALLDNEIRFDVIFLQNFDIDDSSFKEIDHNHPLEKEEMKIELTKVLDQQVEESFARNFPFLRRTALASRGAFRMYIKAVEELQELTPMVKRSGTKFSGMLELTPAVQIPVRIMGRVLRASVPTATKLSLEATIDKKTPVRANTETAYLQGDKEVKTEDLIKGYSYGSTLLPVNPVDEETLRFTAPRRFCLLKIVPSSCITRAHLTGPVDSVIATKEKPEAEHRFKCLWKALLDAKELAIARLVKREDSGPDLVVLWPHPELPILFSCSLPTLEDMRTVHFLNFNVAVEKVEDKEADAARDFVASKRIESWENWTSCLDPSERPMFDSFGAPWTVAKPFLRHLYLSIIQKLVNGPSSHLPKPSKFIKLLQQLAKPTENPSTQTPLKEFETVRKRLRSKEALASEKRLRPDGQTSFDQPLDRFYPGIVANVPTEVGEMKPLEDFEAMVSYKREDLFVKAVGSMFEVITKVIGNSAGGDGFEKATGCMAALRRACQRNNDFALFNEFLETIVTTAENGDTNFKSFVSQIASNAATASALRLLHQKDLDTDATAPEEVEAMQQRLLNAGRKEPTMSLSASGITDLPAQSAADDGDLGNMIDDII